MFSQLKYSLYIDQNLVGRPGMGIEKKSTKYPFGNQCFHGNREGGFGGKNLLTTYIIL